MCLNLMLIALLITWLASVALAAPAALPPLGPQDTLRHLHAPYDLLETHCLGMNYCEALLDGRISVPGYTHLGFDCNHLDAWHLQFPDDCARLVEGLCWEDEYSPVVRLEMARRVTKGLIAAHYPGTRSYYAFRHRSGGKTDILLDDSASGNAGRMQISNWGDAVTGLVKIGFRANIGGRWTEIESFEHTDEPQGCGALSYARSPQTWNESPVALHRHYTSAAGTVDFRGRYWMSDEDLPFELRFESGTADRLQAVLGEPGKHMPLMVDAGAPGFIHLPDRKTVHQSTEGDLALESVDFDYLILRKAAAWACPGYSSALLVMWKERPQRIEAVSENGYGQLRLEFGRRGGRCLATVWVLPFQWVDSTDMEYVYRNAESFLETGKLLHNGFPTQQLLNAIPTGLAAGAYLLAKYNDPYAPTARAAARNAVDDLLAGLDEGRSLVRRFFVARAAAWMVRAEKQSGHSTRAAIYGASLRRAMDEMLSDQSGYDGKGWARFGGWDHFNNSKTCWLAYAATGEKRYREAWQRSLEAYTIDQHGIYANGRKLAAPGGLDTYAGALPLAAWGHAGRLDWVETLLNLDVPNGWHNPEIPVKDLFNDAGAGPWAQEDANVDYVGFCLRGLGLPVWPKTIVPLGSFPVFDRSGRVTLTDASPIENPFFPAGSARCVIAADDRSIPPPVVKEIRFRPDAPEARAHRVGDHIWRFDTRGAKGAAVDLLIEGSYRVEASSDGRRWFGVLDSWSPAPREQSVDLSFLTGCPDLPVPIASIAPPEDDAALVDTGGSEIRREHCRYAQPEGSFIYAFDARGLVECHLEMIAGNDYAVECSSDRRSWKKALDFTSQPMRAGIDWSDAAWIRRIDATSFLGGDRFYVRFRDAGSAGKFDTRTAFLRRLRVCGVMDSVQVYVRVVGMPGRSGRLCRLSDLTFRTW